MAERDPGRGVRRGAAVATHTPPLVITPGEPAGIGPDLVLTLAQEARQTAWVIAADAACLAARAETLGLAIAIDHNIDSPAMAAGALSVLDVPLDSPVSAGSPSPDNAAAVLASIDRAVAGCMAGEFAGLVTGPVQKSVIAASGVDFSGHTEYLAGLAGADDVVMLLAAGEFRVALATTHLPLREVADAIDAALLTRRLHILNDALVARFEISRPRIVVAGLNPHAGEAGYLGREEIEIIEPVCAELCAAGLDIVGPLPADTLFTPRHLDEADAVLAMYHDQGLPVLKYAGFGHAVNVTLGLPIVRTSVDHGTAFDLAGSGAADAGSMRAAIDLAAELARSD